MAGKTPAQRRSEHWPLHRCRRPRAHAEGASPPVGSARVPRSAMASGASLLPSGPQTSESEPTRFFSLNVPRRGL